MIPPWATLLSQPPKITVKPGESVEAEPMVSRLGVSGDEMPLTVKLQCDGRTEQQVLTLRAVKDAAGRSCTAVRRPPSRRPRRPAPERPAGYEVV